MNSIDIFPKMKDSSKDIYLNIRPLQKNYLQLLQTLSKIDPETISSTEFTQFLQGLNKLHNIFVIEDLSQKQIIASITVLIEPKLIHNLSNVAHIENVVVASNYQKKGLGQKLVNYVTSYAQKHNCYKTILHCDSAKTTFYQKSGFSHKSAGMAKYL